LVRATREPDREDIFAAVANERRQIASLISGLSDAQLATPSLCSGWDVKTVAAHLACSLTDGLPAQWKTALRRGSLARATDEFARRRGRLPAAEIAATLRERADYRLSPPIVGVVAVLADILIHGGDIRIPLGLPFEPDAGQAADAMGFLTGTWAFAFVPRGRLSGIRFTDSETGKSWRKGAEVRGPAAALMMAVSGRTALFETLEGPGLQLLGQRLASG
jgi:uncharacterized protein (TIGR03083 family)